MLGILEYVIGMLRILANEVEDPEDGEERICTSSVAFGDTFPSRGRHEGKEERA